MIEALRIKNYKSIVNMKLKLGRVNLIIGENGCGKSNILEAIALSSATEDSSLKKSELVSRGVRIIDDSDLMVSNFIELEDDQKSQSIEVEMFFSGDNQKNCKVSELPSSRYTITPHMEDSSYIRFKSDSVSSYQRDGKRKKILNEEITDSVISLSDVMAQFFDLVKSNEIKIDLEDVKKSANEYEDNALLKELSKSVSTEEFVTKAQNLAPSDETVIEAKNQKAVRQLLEHEKEKIKDFLIYSPENTALRNFYKEKQVEPLGTCGEGLLKLLKSLSKDKSAMETINKVLGLFGWYDSVTIPERLSSSEDKVYIKDKYVKDLFDQRSANEGFLFILFYVSLLVSDETPKVFAIDNIDASLNPRLCIKLMEIITKLAEANDKQVFLTTHNPAILDGFDIKKSSNKLIVVSRDTETGHTVQKTISSKKNLSRADGKPLKLSEAFLRGYFGGLPKEF
ncbi:AAA family ATPase [Vibrio sp. FF145]|uniref:AAA family ATPase n=1 Tax=unclassified Vibrio TaxID=2614977 RepID=UPI00352C7F81